METILQPLESGGDVRKDWRAINDIISYLDPEAARTANPGDGQRGFGSSAARFGLQREYDYDRNYAPGQLVIVSPTNDAVLDGNATAGLWLCVKIGARAAEFDAGDPTVHCPIWPLPNVDPDHADNYWMLIAFYPTRMTYCVSGVNTDYYVNAQPVPVE